MSDDSTVEQAEESKTKLQKGGLFLGETNINTKKNILFEKQKGGYLATRYLIEPGRRQNCLHQACADAGGINGRVSGYRRAYKEAGLPFNSNLLVEGDFSMESGMAAVKKLLGKLLRLFLPAMI